MGPSNNNAHKRCLCTTKVLPGVIWYEIGNSKDITNTEIIDL